MRVREEDKRVVAEKVYPFMEKKPYLVCMGSLRNNTTIITDGCRFDESCNALICSTHSTVNNYHSCSIIAEAAGFVLKLEIKNRFFSREKCITLYGLTNGVSSTGTKKIKWEFTLHPNNIGKELYNKYMGLVESKIQESLYVKVEK